MITSKYFAAVSVLFLTTLSLPALAQGDQNVCFVFKGGSYTGSQVSKDQFFALVASEGSLNCSYGTVVGSSEARFYAKNPETNQVNRLGGELVGEHEAMNLATENKVQFHSCTRIVCGQNAVNTSPGMVEPEEQIRQHAETAAKVVVDNVLDSSLKKYFQLISYAHQIKNGLSGISEAYLQDKATGTSAFKDGYAKGLKACSESCVADGEAQGKNSASYQASYKVDSILNSAFQKSQKPVFQPMVTPSQQEQLKSLTPHRRYEESVAHYWEVGNSEFVGKIRSVSTCGSTDCRNYGGISVRSNDSLSSLTALLSSSKNLLDYNNDIDLDDVYRFFENQTVTVDSSLYTYFKSITTSSKYQNKSENEETFKKHFKTAAEAAIRSQWTTEINKYANYHPVDNHVTEIMQSVVESLGYSLGYNRGYAEKFSAPAQVGYSKVFDQAYKASYDKRINYYNTNAVFADVKVAFSNVQASAHYAPYDEVLLTLRGISNKGFVEGAITCELYSTDEKVLPLGKKAFKIPAYTKTDKEVPLGALGKVRGEKVSPNEVVYFVARCGEDSYSVNMKVTWAETIKRLGQTVRPEVTKSLVTYIRYHFNVAYNTKFKSYKMEDKGFDVLAQQFIAVYKNSSTVERARMDAVKELIVKGAFGEEPKKKLFNANREYKMHQVMKGYFSQIGWTVAPKK